VTPQANGASLRPSYDYVIVGAGAAGCVVASELSASGAHVLLIESGGTDEAPTVLNPSVWFYNVGGPLDYSLPIVPTAGLNQREFKMALGHVLGGGSSINAMVWTRGMERDFEGWVHAGAKVWAFKDVLPIYKAQEDWEGGECVARRWWSGARASPQTSASDRTSLCRGGARNGDAHPRGHERALPAGGGLHQHEHQRGRDARQRRSRVSATCAVSSEPHTLAEE